VLAKPKHIVSGDFHWIEKHNNKVFIAVSDCTGHGVPGAFISIIGYKLLTKFIIEYGLSNPAEILNQLNNEFFVSDKQIIESVFEIKDGLDIALCIVDKSKMTMMYAGAYNPVYQIRKGEFTKLSVDKIPIHLFTKHTGKKFTNHEIKIEKDDIYYMFSDGYASQFGGTKGGKFMRKNLQELILSIQHLTMSEQREIFNNSIEEWKNAFGEEQTDDILILGFKIL
jgi:serine phosphatase RsbU (regulator of sigma subunit)